jgi:hypothetical protein
MKNLLIFSLLLLVSTSAFSGDRLDGDGIKSFLSNKTLTGVHFKKGNIKTYYTQDGKVTSKGDDGSVRKGKWWVKKNKRCIRWTHKPKNLCHYIEKNGDGTHVLIHGRKGFRIVEIKSAVDGNKL